MFARRTLSSMRFAALCLVAFAALPSLAQDQPPAFTIATDESKITFYIKSSVALEGTFKKWDASMTFTSPDVTTGVLDIKIQADSVDTGSGMKDGKIKSKDFFDVENDPFITFHSDKVVQTSPTTFDLPGTFTIRGVSKPETLTFTASGTRGSGSGDIKGTMAFDRKDYGMNKGIPFVKIADRVEVTVNLEVKRTSGPPLVFKK
jgi:polyisoprenoid-binding protein YceI